VQAYRRAGRSAKEINMKHIVTLVCLALWLCTALPLPAQETIAADTGASSDIGPIEAAIAADARITEQIRIILIELEGYDGVQVSVRSGIVTLTGEVLDTTALQRLDALVTGIDGVIAIQNEVEETTDLAKRLNPAFQRLEERLRQTVARLPLFGVALAAAWLIWFIGVRIARLRQPWDRIAPNAFIADIYRQLVVLAFALVGIVIALDILNATALLGTILGAAGIIGLALGFAVRDTVENFIASIMLSVRQPFQPNDTVEIEGDQGKVIRLTSRATILLSFDGNHIRIPNSIVFKSRIINFTRNAERRYQFDITISPLSDLASVRKLIEDTVTALPFTLDTPGTSVWIQDLTPSGVVFTVTGWIDQTTTSLLRARGETLRLVKQAIEEAGYVISDSTYNIQMIPFSEPPEQDQTIAQPPKIQVIGVDALDDEALEGLIAEERNDETNPDLLRRDAPNE